MFKTSSLYEANLNCTADVIVNQGGTSSGKTYSILQVLFTKAAQSRDQVITVVGQDIPNLKVGALRDAKDIFYSSDVLKSMVLGYNSTDRIFTFHNGSIIEFKSYEDAQDAKSGKRDYLFVNEINGIQQNIYTELALRTKKQVFIDYNPNEHFWVHDSIIPQESTQLFISDHRHNPFVADKIRQKIESIKDVDKELWKVYARGLTGKVEGLIFPNCTIVQRVPEGAKSVGKGLDFGFTNDPTTNVAVYLNAGELWLDELIYETGLTNPDIVKRFAEVGITRSDEVIADSAEPKSIEEIHRLGYNIKPALKGPDSIKNGIDILKRYKINITARSKNLIKEQKSYKWATDKDGKQLNIPIGIYNHCWDAVRYVALNKLSVQPKNTMKFSTN